MAQAVGCSLSATTYYFTGLDDLLAEAGRANINRWASRAERVRTDTPPRTAEEAIDLVLAATLPTDEKLLRHYLQLVAAGGSEPVSQAYQTGRDRLNLAVGRVLRSIGSPWSPEMIIAVVDGACVSAISEGRDPKQVARRLLLELRSANPVLPLADELDPPDREA